MQALRWGLVTIANRDLADFGFVLEQATGLTGAVTVGQSRVEVRDAAGSIITDAAHRLSAGPITLQLAHVAGGTQEACQAALDRVTNWLSLGPALLWQRQRPQHTLLVSWSGHAVVTPGKYFNRPVLKGTIGLVRESPYYRDRYESRVVALGNGVANRVAVPTGTAPHYCTIMVRGASQFTLTQRAWDGSIVRQSIISTTGGNDAFMVDTARRRLIRLAAGTFTEDAKALTLGHGFFTAEPRWANYEKQRWQTFETSAGTDMVIDYARHYLA